MCAIHDKCTCLNTLRSQFVVVKDKFAYELKNKNPISKEEKLYKAGMLIGFKKAVVLVDDALTEIGRGAMTRGLK